VRLLKVVAPLPPMVWAEEPLKVIVPALAVKVPSFVQFPKALKDEFVFTVFPESIVMLKGWFPDVVIVLALLPVKRTVHVPPPHPKEPAVLEKFPAIEMVLLLLTFSVLPEALIVR